MPPVRLSSAKKDQSWMEAIRSVLVIIAILYGIYMIQQNWDDRQTYIDQGIEQIDKGTKWVKKQVSSDLGN